MESYENARTAIAHVYFIALTFAGSLERDLNTRSVASFSNNFLRTRQMLIHVSV